MYSPTAIRALSDYVILYVMISMLLGCRLNTSEKFSYTKYCYFVRKIITELTLEFVDSHQNRDFFCPQYRVVCNKTPHPCFYHPLAFCSRSAPITTEYGSWWIIMSASGNKFSNLSSTRSEISCALISGIVSSSSRCN